MWSDDIIIGMMVLGVVAFYLYFLAQIRKRWIEFKRREQQASKARTVIIFYFVVIAGFSVLVVPAVLELVGLEIIRHR